MADLDGLFILETLHSLEQPATLKLIVSTVAKACGTKTNQVQNAVKNILEGGVKHGYVQYANGKYYAENYDADEGGIVSTKPPVKNAGDNQPEDATRRRRRSSSSRRRRSGSRRSRSRRRSSTRR